MSDFDRKIKNIELELTALKTVSEYTSVKSANFTSGFKATAGLYKITFQSSEDVLSIVYCADANGNWGSGNVYGRTPSGNNQLVEVGYSDFVVSGSDTSTVPIVVISNSPVVSIVRL